MDLKEAYNRCKPEAWIPADDPNGWYVDFDAEGLRGSRCVDRMRATITLADAFLEKLPDAVTGKYVMLYANGYRWYDAHPLLEDLLRTHGEE